MNIEEKVYANDGNPDLLSKITKHNAVILDVGCGDGSNARVLVKNNNIIDGVTLSEKEAEIASKSCRKVFIHNLEQGLPALEAKSYDYVICSHVLEHICLPEKLFADIKNVLKDDGKLLIALPNLFHFKSRLEIFKGNFYYKESGIWDNTHYKWYTFKTAQDLLKQHGFTCEIAYTTGELPFLSRVEFIQKSIFYKKLSAALLKSAPGFWGYQLVFVARKSTAN